MPGKQIDFHLRNLEVNKVSHTILVESRMALSEAELDTTTPWINFDTTVRTLRNYINNNIMYFDDPLSVPAPIPYGVEAAARDPAPNRYFSTLVR
ncbi:hypothetical protein MBANPS3_011171 [Mucor bainieri]